VTEIGGVADLAHFTVTYDVNARPGLLSHCIAHSAPHCLLEMGGVVGFSAVLREQQIDDFLWTRQAADMSGENALGAEFHFVSPAVPASGARVSRQTVIDSGVCREFDA
jgi:hypothetical protein